MKSIEERLRYECANSGTDPFMDSGAPMTPRVAKSVLDMFARLSRPKLHVNTRTGAVAKAFQERLF